MADVKKIATRDAYGKALAALGAEHENLVVLDADLANASMFGVMLLPRSAMVPFCTPCLIFGR